MQKPMNLEKNRCQAFSVANVNFIKKNMKKEI